MLIEGVDYYVTGFPFPYNDSAMFVLPNDDGTHTIVCNLNLTHEQLVDHAPHELRHILKNHFHDERSIAEIEAEAEGHPAPEPPVPQPPRGKKFVPYFESPQELAEWIMSFEPRKTTA